MRKSLEVLANLLTVVGLIVVLAVALLGSGIVRAADGLTCDQQAGYALDAIALAQDGVEPGDATVMLADKYRQRDAGIAPHAARIAVAFGYRDEVRKYPPAIGATVLRIDCENLKQRD